MDLFITTRRYSTTLKTHTNTLTKSKKDTHKHKCGSMNALSKRRKSNNEIHNHLTKKDRYEYL